MTGTDNRKNNSLKDGRDDGRAMGGKGDGEMGRIRGGMMERTRGDGRMMNWKWNQLWDGSWNRLWYFSVTFVCLN
jgi:hypothetical protein